MTSRGAALVGLVVLGTGLAVTVALATPWHPLGTAVPGGHLAVSAGRDFTPVQVARQAAFHRAVRPPAYLGLAVGLLVAAGLGCSPLGARLVGAVARPLGGGWAWRAALGAIVLTTVGRLAALPFDAWSERVLRRYGLSTQGWPAWLIDQARGLGISAAAVTIAVLVLYALVRVAPRSWWAWMGLAGAVLVFAASFAYPLLVEPVFNRFSPLPAGELRASLLQLAADDGVPVRQVVVADASRRTSSLNAYVSGLGPSRRIVVYDTLLRPPTTPAQVRLVVAHELGHAKRQDVLHATLAGMLAAGVASCAAFLVLGWGPLLRRAGVSSVADPRSVALVLLLAAAAGVLTAPVQSLVSRRVEARADVHALDLTRDPDAFVASFRRLAVANLSDLAPNPVAYAIFADHPTPPERIELAREWSRSRGLPSP